MGLILIRMVYVWALKETVLGPDYEGDTYIGSRMKLFLVFVLGKKWGLGIVFWFEKM